MERGRVGREQVPRSRGVGEANPAAMEPGLVGREHGSQITAPSTCDSAVRCERCR